MNLATTDSRPHAGALAPALVRIPEGWFLMGCDTGQDNEKPVHRVWVDEFLLAACQVTNAEYARFLHDTRSQPPPFWSDANFNHPHQPVVGVSWHEAVSYCEWLSLRTGRAFRLPTEAEWERAARGGREGELYPWGDAPPPSLPGYADRCQAHWKTGPEPVGSRRIQRDTASTTCATTSTSGAATGTAPATIPSRPTAIPAALKPASGALPAAVPGATTSKCRAAPPAPAFRRSSSMPTMASASPATDEVKSQKSN